MRSVATTTESPSAADVLRPSGVAVLVRLRSLLVWLHKFIYPPAHDVEEPPLTFSARFRKFLWLSSGLFSAASFTIPAIGYLAFGTADGAATNFLAAVVSACLFGVASLFHFGPDEA